MKRFCWILILLVGSHLFTWMPLCADDDHWEGRLSAVRSMQREDLQAALDEAWNGLEQARAERDRLWQVRFLGEICWTNQELGNYPAALRAGIEGEDLAAREGFRPELGDIRNFLGLTWFNLGDYAAAESLIQESFAIRQSLGDTRGMASCLNNLSRVFLVQSLHGRAMEVLDQALELKFPVDDPDAATTRFQIQLNRGVIMENLARYSEAEAIFLELEEEIDDSAPLHLRQELVLSKASLYRASSQWEKLSRCIEESHRYFSYGGGGVRYISFLGLKARSLEQEGELERARDLLEEGLSICRENGESFFIWRPLLFDLGRLYASMEDYQKAYLRIHELWSVENQMRQKTLAGKLAHLQVRFDMKSKETQVLELSQSVKLQELALEKEKLSRQLALNSLYFSIGIAGILLFLAVQQVRQRKRLETLNKELDNFQRMAAHDLKNPLSAIVGYADLLAESEELEPEEWREWGRYIQFSSEQMFGIINNLLELQRMENRQWKLEPEDIPVENMLQRMISGYGHRIREKEQEVTVDVQPDQLSIDQDLFSLQRILENLFSNAIKFTPNRGKIRLIAHCTEDGRKVVFRCEDSGPGFKDEDFPKLFKKFSRLSARPTGMESSTGLGLSIAKQLAQLMGGDLTCRNHEHGGAVFLLELPDNPAPVVEDS